ncbi:hypothetical protein IU449_01925 [Nocardia higoensis]|uniref:Uncharacterized protein n=1 Tax=Nocardia higoensis TaxID=228599 RepID=A0ABS0D5D5_9NOCA|nr:hypothetical protein [Nocardia higoensis]MBF6353315.1 hypothetical protein [Nocardia higoensis]
MIPAVPAGAGSLVWGLEAFSAWMAAQEGKAQVPYLETGLSVAEWVGRQAVAGVVVAALLFAGAVSIGSRTAMGHMLIIAGCCLATGMHAFGWWFLHENADRLDGPPFAVIFHPVLALFPILTIALTWFCLPSAPLSDSAARRSRSGSAR